MVAAALLFALTALSAGEIPIRAGRAQGSASAYTEPRWIAKMRTLDTGASGQSSSSILVGKNVDVSNEPGPQSEEFVAANPQDPNSLAGGSNEIFRGPQRTYFSSNGGKSWTGVDQPLVDELGTEWTFASDPGVAYDTRGDAFFSQLLIFSVNNNFKGDELVVNRTTDGGASFGPGVIVKRDLNAGTEGRFEDKPLIAADANLSSPFRDNVYVAWDTAQNAQAKVQFARSIDHGQTFSVQRIDDSNSGASASEIGADPAVGPNGEVYVAWLDISHSRLQLDRSFDGGVTFGSDSTISQTTIPFDTGIPAMKVRRALVYPSTDVDRSNGPHRGRVYATWTDQADQTQGFVDGSETDVFFSFSDDAGRTWSTPRRLADDTVHADQFNQWLAVDPVDGSVNVSWIDTRNDPTNKRKTDIYFTRSTDGGATFSPNVRVTDASTDESSPLCEARLAQTGFTSDTIRYCRQVSDSEIFNQYGDYTGLASFAGTSHPIWTDRSSGERLNEEIFTASIKAK